MIAQLLANSLYSAAVYILVGLGFGLIYSVARFLHIAHGVVFTAGGYFLFVLHSILGVPVVLAGALSICATAVLGLLLHVCIHEPLVRREASSLIHFIASFGLYVVLENAYALLFGDENRMIRSAHINPGWTILGASITTVQILTIGSAVVSGLLLTIMNRTRLGFAFSAISMSPGLAEAVGIDRERFIRIAFVIGSAVAGLAGCLVAYDLDVRPTMGMSFLIVAVISVIVGGVGSATGLVVAAFFLAVSQHLASFFLSTQWHDAIAFILLFFVVVIRPRGIRRRGE